MDDLFGWSNGSTDESNIKLTGFELLLIYKYTKNNILVFLLILCNILDSALIQIRLIIEGKLATVLIDSNYDSPDEFLDAINYISFLIIITIISKIIINIFDATLVFIYSIRLGKYLHAEIMSKVLDQDITFFDSTLTGVILSRLNDDVTNSCDALSQIFFDFLYCLVDFVIGIIICFTQSWKITLIVFFCFPIYCLSQLIGNRYINRLYINYNDKSTKASSKGEEILTCFRTVRPFDAELREYHKYRQNLFDVHNVITKTCFIRGIQNSIEYITHWGYNFFCSFFLQVFKL